MNDHTVLPSPHHDNNNNNNNDAMRVDDTRDRIYITDLDAELAELDSEETRKQNEEKLIFLPDIEKQFSKIPEQVLWGRSDDRECHELVLYSIPETQNIDHGHDFVRRAILETRARAREKAVQDARQHETLDPSMQDNAHEMEGWNRGHSDEQSKLGEDDDAMDID